MEKESTVLSKCQQIVSEANMLFKQIKSLLKNNNFLWRSSPQTEVEMEGKSNYGRTTCTLVGHSFMVKNKDEPDILETDIFTSYVYHVPGWCNLTTLASTDLIAKLPLNLKFTLTKTTCGTDDK